MSRQIENEFAAVEEAMDDHLAQLVPPVDVAVPDSLVGRRLALVHPQESLALLEPQAELVQQSAEFALASPFIRGNEVYRQRLGQVGFALVPKDTTVNAFATDAAITLPDGRTLGSPAIVYFGGLGVAVRLAAVALAAHIQASVHPACSTRAVSLPGVFRAMGAALVKSGGHFDTTASIEVFRTHVVPGAVGQSEQLVSLARSLAASMDMFIVAHEAGHIALAHTLGQQHNYDVARNQEREADSFAASTLSTSPFREYLFIGQVFVTIVFAWVDHAADSAEPGTHPLGRERFLNAMVSNSEAAKEAADRFGLSRERLMDLLPPEYRRPLGTRREI